MRNISLAIVVGLVVVSGVWGEEPPVIPVGLDAYREWHRWPQQRIGARAYMRSTYDRLGGNLTADASTFLYQENDQCDHPKGNIRAGPFEYFVDL